MASPEPHALKWSEQLVLASSRKRLVGDKIALPQSALEALLAAAPVVQIEHGGHRNLTSSFDPFNQFSFAAEVRAREAFAERQQQLPHPLTFRLVNPANGQTVYAGIREFSAHGGTVELSAFLRSALGFALDSSEQPTREATPDGDVTMSNGVGDKTTAVTVHAQQLPKGTYVRLRPLEAGYDAEDWKSLLERYLRDTHTTLTLNEILDIKGARHEHFRFLVDKFEPEGEGICIVDTDLEVDIEALNEEQARETLERRLAKARQAPGTEHGSSSGRTIEPGAIVEGQVLPGEYVDYRLETWDRSRDLQIVLESDKESVSIPDVLITPVSGHQRSLPRADEFVFADLSNSAKKTVIIRSTNAELENAEALAISTYAWRDAAVSQTQPVTFSLRVEYAGSSIEEAPDAADLSPDETICKNCRQKIPKRTLPLHEAFCYRNNVVCQICSNVYLKHSDSWKHHWHCPHDNESADSDVGKDKHNTLFHPPTPLKCPGCDFEAYDVAILAQHRTSTCPDKVILCQFCHLEVPQQGPDDPSFTDAEVLMSGLTPHELADGARTTECHMCSRIVRLRDMRTHLALHDRERLSRPEPRVCINEMCSRTIAAGDESRAVNEQLGLCNTCFGPLYNSVHDPEGKALRRRIERRLLQQLMGGCGKAWCQNHAWCRTGHKNVTGEERIYTAKDALPIVRPVMERLNQDKDAKTVAFCVDESQQRRTVLVNFLSNDEAAYSRGWIAKAVEETKGDPSSAEAWLKERAPTIQESK
jgi:hypothetical protein